MNYINYVNVPLAAGLEQSIWSEFSQTVIPKDSEVAVLERLYPGELESVLGRSWQELRFEYVVGEAFLLTAIGLAYYVPAFLTYGLRDPYQGTGDILPSAILLHMQSIYDGELLTQKQWQLVGRSLAYLETFEIDGADVHEEYKAIFEWLDSHGLSFKSEES